MKVSKADAVEFLRDVCGFEKAEEWDGKKLLGRLKLVPDKVKEEDVPEAHKAFFKSLVEGNGNISIEGVEMKGEGAKDKKAADKKGGKKEVEKSKKKGKEKPVREEDEYGAAVGTIRAKVNATLSKDWKPIEEIVEESGVKARQAKIRLRRAVKEKTLEVRRRVEYRLVSKK